MALLRGGILSHKLVNLNCVGLISGASISGLIYDLRHEKRVINLINKFGESISNLFSSTEKPEEKREPKRIFYWFIQRRTTRKNSKGY